MNILNHKHVKIRNIRHHPTLTDFNNLFTLGSELDHRYYLHPIRDHASGPFADDVNKNRIRGKTNENRPNYQGKACSGR